MRTVTLTAITAFLALSMLSVVLADTGRGLPSSHMIANIPWNQQMNSLFCGEGVLEGGGR